MPAPPGRRRAERRYRCTRHHPVRLANWPAAGAQGAALRDVSRRGVGLLTEQALPPGSVLLVEPQAPRGAVPNVLTAEVRHATALAGGRWILGCSLVRRLADAELLALL